MGNLKQIQGPAWHLPVNVYVTGLTGVLFLYKPFEGFRRQSFLGIRLHCALRHFRICSRQKYEVEVFPPLKTPNDEEL